MDNLEIETGKFQGKLKMGRGDRARGLWGYNLVLEYLPSIVRTRVSYSVPENEK